MVILCGGDLRWNRLWLGDLHDGLRRIGRTLVLSVQRRVRARQENGDPKEQHQLKQSAIIQAVLYLCLVAFLETHNTTMGSVG